MSKRLAAGRIKIHTEGTVQLVNEQKLKHEKEDLNYALCVSSWGKAEVRTISR